MLSAEEELLWCATTAECLQLLNQALERSRTAQVAAAAKSQLTVAELHSEVARLQRKVALLESEVGQLQERMTLSHKELENATGQLQVWASIAILHNSSHV